MNQSAGTAPTGAAGSRGPGCRSSVRDRQRAGRDGPCERGAAGRDGPADLARLGSSLQRGRDCRAQQPRGAGALTKVDGGQMAALKAVVLAGPDPVVDGVVRWRIVDLCRWVEERWSVSYSETGMLRLLWSLDLSHRKTRPRHPQTDEKAQQAFKKGALQRA